MKAKEELTIIEIVNKSTDFLSSKGIESAKSEVEWILSSVLETTRVQLYLDHENLVSEEKVNFIRDMVMKRGKRIPLQHILGNTNFFGMPIRCDSRALVPRMETEQMVEQIVDRINNSLDGHVVDLGTGTGAILLSLCSALENCTGTGYDNSMQAIELARENLSGKKCEKRVGFELLDWNELTPDTLGTSANLVVSNQYEQHELTLKNGSVMMGKIVTDSEDEYSLVQSGLEPLKLTQVKKFEVESKKASKLSMMPGGLINSMNAEELKDLMAYFVSGGDRKHKVFRPLKKLQNLAIFLDPLLPYQHLLLA